MIYSVQYTKSEEKKLPIFLRVIGINYKQEPVFRPKGNFMMQWFYCSKGKGEVTINGKKFLLTPGYGMLIHPHVPHSYHAVSDRWIMHFFGCEGKLLAHLLKSLDMQESGIYSFSDQQMFSQHIQRLEQLRLKDSPGKKRDYSKECYSFLLDLSSSITKTDHMIAENNNIILGQIIDYLETHYAEDISIRDISKMIHLSPDYTCTYFKKYMGQTILSFLQMVRLAEAKHQLMHYPEKSVCEIAKACGFRSPSYFGKIFKDNTNLTPAQYRRSDYLGY